MENSGFYIGLNLIKGVGTTISRRVVELFGSIDNLKKASLSDIRQVEGISEKTAKNIFGFHWETEVEKEKKRAELLGARIVVINSDEYPELLKNIYDPPCVLYVKGEVDLRNVVTAAIVGSRVPSGYGRVMAEKLSREIAEKGIVTVSGLARGIDSIAHKTTINVRGKTIGVLGTGIDSVYPRENSKLYKDVTKSGMIISEFPIGTRPDKMNFPRRNRIISGLSFCTLVIEAGEKSGTLITARFAIDQGRDVFAVPGNVTSGKSRGTNRLIKNGAKLVENVNDIIDELPYNTKTILKLSDKVSKNGSFPVTDDEKKLLSIMQSKEMHIDSLVEKMELPPEIVSGMLLRLELREMVLQLHGKKYIRRQ